MSARPRHPDKEVERAIQYAERKGWRVVKRSGHAWGRLRCPFADRNGCQVSVWSTPRNAGAHARQIMMGVDKCSHAEGDDDG